MINYPRGLVAQVPGPLFDQTKMKKTEWMALADATSTLKGGCHIVSWNEGMSIAYFYKSPLTLLVQPRRQLFMVPTCFRRSTL